MIRPPPRSPLSPYTTLSRSKFLELLVGDDVATRPNTRQRAIFDLPTRRQRGLAVSPPSCPCPSVEQQTPTRCTLGVRERVRHCGVARDWRRHFPLWRSGGRGGV